MKNFLIVLILSIFATLARSQEPSDDSFYVYGVLQAQREYNELGEADDDEVRYDHHFDQSPFGLGAEYRFEDDGKFLMGAGVLYQPALEERSVTAFSSSAQPSLFTSDDDSLEIAMTHIYGNIYNRVSERVKFLLGVQYTFPHLETDGRFEDYKINNGVGYRIGLEADVASAWSTQIYYRQLVLDTEDKIDSEDYEGEIDMSSFMFALGYRF